MSVAIAQILLLSFVCGPINDSKTKPEVYHVVDFLPSDFVRDGTVCYQKEIQRALDAAAKKNASVVFAPMKYRVDDQGWTVYSGLSLSMHGAIFLLDDKCEADGQLFHGKNVSNVTFHGGEIVGRNDLWPEGVNIRGIYLTGFCTNIRIRGMTMRGLSSNGIGVFGDPKKPSRDIWVSDCAIENGCNHYGDYLSKRVGPEKGSVRQDQGLIALYYVDDFTVRDCRFDKSRSDGTHFYRCRRGQFLGNKVYAAQMGGYFLETCDDILAADNIIRDNGSRGVTIERGSRNCTLKNCVVANSGREGLWAPQCTGLIISGNVFSYNGRKPNGPKPHQIWSSNITVNEDPFDPTKSTTADYLIVDNIIYTSKSQTAAIRIDGAKVDGIVISNNLLRGDNRAIQVEGGKKGTVLLRDNIE